MNTAYLGLGSNLGDRRRHLAGALRRLQAGAGIRIAEVSSVYETKPVGVAGQPIFLNLVARITTTRSAHELLDQCLRVEAGLGRVRRERWGPRTIDIDLLLYGDARINDGRLTVPHPRMRERGFVLAPLAEIAPGLLLAGKTAGALAARIGQAGVRKLGSLEWNAAPAECPGAASG